MNMEDPLKNQPPELKGRAYYADFRYGVGFRCHPCNVSEGPFLDFLVGDWFYDIEFEEFIEGTISEEQLMICAPAYHIFEEPIELVDLPQECYWGWKK